MKRLFQINTPNGKMYRDDDDIAHFYENKQAAKAQRDVLNSALPVDAHPRYTVARGPDHWRNS